MSTRVLYLHGIGNPQRVEHLRWLGPINDALVASGRLPIAMEDVVHPNYADLWAQGNDEERPVNLDEDARYAFIDRQSRLSDRLYPDGAGSKRGQYHEPPAVENLIIDKGLSQVRDFLKHHWHPKIRDRILEAMGDPSGDWLIFGHSLGTAVALEFLTQLPSGLHAPLVLTVASPLGRKPFRRFVDRCFERIDFDAVGGWLNVYNIHDMVPGGHGFSTQVPEAVNYVVTGAAFDHSAATAVLPAPVAAEVGIALYGTETKDVGTPHVDVPMGADLLTVIALQYAWHVERLLKESDSDATRGKGARFGEARAVLANQLAHAASLAGSPLADLNLTGDLAPVLRGSVTRTQAARIAVAICAMNPIAPFEIDVKREVLHRARRLLAHDLGWNHTFIDHAHDALGSARSVYRAPIMRWVQASAPTVSTAQGPTGLGSGSVSLGGLAALGPGGMAGLLALSMPHDGDSASNLEGLGSAISRLPNEELEEAVIEILASARTAQLLKFAEVANFDEWAMLQRALTHAREDDDAIVRLSDKGAAVVKSAGKRVETLEKAIHWLIDHHLAPDNAH